MKLGVVTPVLDGRARFRACASSVRAAAAALRGGEIVHFGRESAASKEPVEDLAAEFGCVYERAPDRGLYDAIAAGLDAACAAGCDALAWLNADEQWLPDAPGHAQRFFETNAGIGLVFGDYLLLGPDGSLRAARRELPARLIYLRNGVNYLLSCTVFFRRSVWEGSARFDLSYTRLADKKWYLGVLSSGVRAALCPRYLGAYAMTGSNASLRPGAAEEQARLRKKQNELKKTEDEIASLEERDSQLDEQLTDPEISSNVGKLMDIHREKESIQERLDQLYELWETLAEEV